MASSTGTDTGEMTTLQFFERGHSRRNPDRYRVVRYFIIGGISALMDFILFAILIKVFSVKWYYANVLSFILVNLVHYMLSIRFVFESGARFCEAPRDSADISGQWSWFAAEPVGPLSFHEAFGSRGFDRQNRRDWHHVFLELHRSPELHFSKTEPDVFLTES